MPPPLAYLAFFLSLWRLMAPTEAATVLVVTPENEASLTLAAQLYREAQDALELPDKERLFRQSIDAYPELAPAYNNLAMLVLERHSRDEAVQLLERGLQAAEATGDRETVANIHNNLGFVTREYGKWSVAHSLAALRHFDAALEIDPEFTGALYNKASVFLALRRDLESKELLLKVLELEPDNRQAHLDLGRIYFEHGDLETALQHEDRVIEMATTNKEKLEGMHNKGLFLKEYVFLARALKVYNQMLAIASVESYVLVDMMNAKRLFCDWRGMETLENQVVAAAQRQFDLELPEEPVQFLPYDSTLLKLPDSFRKTLAIRASKQYEQPSTLELLPLPWREDEPTWDRPLTPQRLKVGYLSFDFRDHPMGHLTLGLIEQHAALAQGVDTICYSYGPNSEASAPWRRQFEEKCGVFRDLLGMSDLEAAQTIGLDGIDVLVDLMAHTKGARLGIPSLRPSRITVNYLGYPGTMGSTFTDFAMVDKSVVPPEVAAKTMTEQVVYLPHTYQANRYEVSIPSCGADAECQQMNRSQHGLPTDTMVFCNFNTINKMESESFSVWMSILRQVPKSVLWLLAPSGEDADRVKELLREQAMAHGVLPSRVIFAPRVDKLSHLARVTVADLFLDSFIYNAHSTAADALWANVPIVTFWGDTFPSRVAASLIQNAIPFPELVSHSLIDYERTAVYLAKTPKVLRRIRSLLASHTLTSPLFNTKQTTESIETAYEVMHDVANRLHPFTKEGSSSRFQLIIHPEHSAGGFENAEIAYARVDEVLRQGILLQESGDHIGARHAYTRVLRASPGNPDAIHLLGTIFYQTGELERAVEYFTRAVTANSQVSWYHSNLGVAYAALEKLDLAETEFHLALKLDPANRIAISKLGELYTTQKAFDRVAELYATYGETAYFLTGQTSASQEDAEKAYLTYSEALVNTGRSLDAIKLLESAVQQHPTLFQLSYNLGVVYNEAGMYDEGNQRQFATVLAQGRYLYETKGKHFTKIPRPEHKVVIAFYCHEYGQEWWEHWGSSSLDTGLGGSEEAVVFLSRELQKLGYWVEIYGDPSPQDVSTLDQADQDVVRWYPHYTYDVDDRGVDMFVAWRYHISLAMGKTAWKKFLWMHDLPQEDAKRSAELLNNVDRIFCLSDFHASMFPDSLQSKITVHTNAVDPSFFVDGPNHADRFVYGSSPSRGLYAVLQAWPRIREAIPTAELSVFYGFRPAFIKWGHSHMANFTEWMAEMNRLLTETPGVRYVGLVDHTQLAKEYSYAGFYLYPTTFSETSCISLMKAMSNGAIPITSRFPASALPETVDEFDLGPRALQQNTIVDDPEWLELWIQSIVDAVRDEQQALTVRHRMKRFTRKKYRWEHIALQWHRVISKPRFP